MRSLAAAALLFTACDQGPRAPSDLYDVSTMELKPTPAKLSSERHQGGGVRRGQLAQPGGIKYSHWIDAQPAGSVKASGGH